MALILMTKPEETEMEEQRNKVQVLVVEDDALQSMKVEALLQSQGYEVRVASDGREALTMMAEFRPDIVVSDILMQQYVVVPAAAAHSTYCWLSHAGECPEQALPRSAP